MENSVKPMNSIVYCRVSSKGQEDGGGLNSQEVACRNYCARQGYRVVEVFRDSFTGGDLDRPGINALFKYIDDHNNKSEHNIDVFVVDDINRIARSYEVHLAITRELTRRNIKYETVNMKFESTPVGKLVEGIMALNSEFFRVENQARVISRQESRLQDGYRPRDYPIGYITEKAPVGGKLLVRDEPNATIITEALEGYASGLLNSASEVAHFLQTRGLDMKRYKKKKKETQKVHISFALRVLNQILYTGYIEYKKTTRDKHGAIKKQRDIPLRKAKHEGLISLETYYKIQEKLKGKRPYEMDIRIVNDDYPLRSFLVCDCCGELLTSGKSKSKSGARIAYYQSSKKCKNYSKSVQSTKLHEQMSEVLKGLGMEKKFLAFMKVLMHQEFEQRKDDNQLNKRNIEKAIADKTKEMDNLIEAIANTGSALVQKKLEQKVEECELKRQQLEAQLVDDKYADGVLEKMNIAFKILEDPHYIREHGDIDQQQMLIRLVFSKKIPVDFSTGTYGTLPIAPLFLHSNDIGDTDYSQLEMTSIELVSKKQCTHILPS